MIGGTPALIGSVAIAALSTLGDFIWKTWIPQHRVMFGLAHGALLFLAIGLFLGIVAKRPAAGACGGALTGALAAGSFYVLRPLLGYPAMFLVWALVWVVLAMLYGWLLGRTFTMPEVGLRGLIAAVASGLAFYLISGIWRPFNPVGWDYLTHFAAWTVAYLPGFAALMNGSRIADRG